MAYQSSGFAIRLPFWVAFPRAWKPALDGACLIALLATLVAGQLVRVPVLSTAVKSAPLLALDLAVAAVWFALVARVVLRKSRLPRDPIIAFAALFAAWAITGVVGSAVRYNLTVQQTAFSSAYLARWLFYLGVYVWVVSLPTRFPATAIVNGLRTTILAFAVFGILQSAFLPNLAFIIYPDAVPYQTWDVQGHRLVSTFLDPNFAGDFIAIGILLTLPRVVRGRPRDLGFFALLFVALFLTASRGSVASMLIGAALVLLALGKRRVLQALPRLTGLTAAGIVLFLLTSPFVGGRGLLNAATSYLQAYNKLTVADWSALQRLWSWQKNIEIIAEHPILGIGFNTLGFVQEHFGMHRVDNSAFGLDGGILFVASLTGLIGLGLYLSIAIVAVRRGFALTRDRRAPRAVRELGASVVGVTGLWLVHGFFVNTLFYAFLMVTIWLLWGSVSLWWRALQNGGNA